MAGLSFAAFHPRQLCANVMVHDRVSSTPLPARSMPSCITGPARCSAGLFFRLVQRSVECPTTLRRVVSYSGDAQRELFHSPQPRVAFAKASLAPLMPEWGFLY